MPETWAKRVGKKIRAAREKWNKTQGDFAADLGTTARTLRDIEGGKACEDSCFRSLALCRLGLDENGDPRRGDMGEYEREIVELYLAAPVHIREAIERLLRYAADKEDGKMRKAGIIPIKKPRGGRGK